MRKLHFVRRLTQESQAMVRLGPWLLIAIVVTFALLRADLAATGALFQSPEGTFQSPASPTAEPMAPPTIAAPTVAPTFTPSVVEPTVPGSEAAPIVTATVELTATTAPTAEPAITAPAVVTPTSAPAEATPEVIPDTPQPEPTDASDRYAEGDSGLKFEWSMLFDSVALGLTYVWLACGVLILLGIPVFFGILWLTSRRLRAQEESAGYEEEPFLDEDAESEPFDE